MGDLIEFKLRTKTKTPRSISVTQTIMHGLVNTLRSEGIDLENEYAYKEIKAITLMVKGLIDIQDNTTSLASGFVESVVEMFDKETKTL